MFARFDENPAMTLQDIKETKRYGQTDAHTNGRTDGQRENSIPTTKFAGGIIDFLLTVKGTTLIIISESGSAISSAKEGKSGFIYNLVKI